MKYRSRTDIVSQILEAANGGTTKTKIMYKAYLSYEQLKEYLAVMMENNLLEHIPSENLFKTTEKGMKFMRAYEHMEAIAGPFQTPIGK
jgi:predicted transcriptional regulator